MKDMTKASNPFYLTFFLLVVCGVSTLVMAVTAVKTDASKLPPNAALDSYSGVKPGDTKWTKEKDAVHFVSGATYSSNAVCDLVWYAATAVRAHLAAAEKKEAK